MPPYVPERRTADEARALADCFDAIQELHRDAEGWVYVWQPLSVEAIEANPRRRNTILSCPFDQLAAKFHEARWEFEAGLPRELYVRQQTYAIRWWAPRERKPDTRPPIAQLRSVFVDLDCHKLKPPLRPNDARLLVEHMIDQWRLPQPNHIDYSGNGTDGGIYLRWLIEPLAGGYDEEGTANYRLWSATMREAVKAFSVVGADSAATDAARVLRVPGSLNAKYLDTGNGGPCFRDTLHVRRIALADLARALGVPEAVDERTPLASPQPVRQTERRQRQARSEEDRTGGRSHPLAAIRNRLNALQRLRSGFREGTRNTALFWFVLTLRDTGKSHAEIEEQAREFASHFVPLLSEAEIARQIASGLKYQPHKLSYAALIRTFGVTETEQSALGFAPIPAIHDANGQIILEHQAFHRNRLRERVEKHRRENGVLSKADRSEVQLAITRARIEDAICRLERDGARITNASLAKAADLSIRTIHRYNAKK